MAITDTSQTKQPVLSTAKVVHPEALSSLLLSTRGELHSTFMNFMEVEPQPATIYFTLRLPTFVDPKAFEQQGQSPEHFLENAIREFTKLLEKQFAFANYEPSHNGVRVSQCSLGYFWVREQTSKADVVFHFFLLTNRTAKFHLGAGVTSTGTIGHKVADCWCQAISLSRREFHWLIEQKQRKILMYSHNQWPTDLMAKVNLVEARLHQSVLLYPDNLNDGIPLFGSSPAQTVPPFKIRG